MAIPVLHLYDVPFASASTIPEGYPFIIEQITDAVITCVKNMCPIRPESEHKITVTVVPPGK